MGYVAVSGGSEAILNTEKLLAYFRLKGKSEPLGVDQIRDQLRLAVDKVMGEGSLYAPTIAALAIKQAEGDSIEASFILRAYRATQPRRYISLAVDTTKMRVIRRISGAFQEIPGGQILGPTRDYTQRLVDFSLLAEDRTQMEQVLRKAGVGIMPERLPDTFPKVVDLLRQEGVLTCLESSEKVYDITRQALTFPSARSAKLQSLTRGETGAMMSLAYSCIRGYGDIHPYLGELRVGYVPLYIQRPGRLEPLYVGRILITEAEIIAQYGEGDKTKKPQLTLGYGLCFGHNELKAMSMGILDRSTRSTSPHKAPAEDEEFVLYHIDGIEASGFVYHWKLPHYVTFQSTLDRLRRSQQLKEEADNAQHQAE
ncbi:Alpha-D-ribose 1-methylphosphonate 5-triphosphate synthase subunit PhnI [Sporomusa silvacetica DSM 10669]|uniref:Alpha-D-ribose 1-methylphosphonate 5-triphosphate synthase subunit PhnI n=1 Tax=Sporomusa silvacetica DSM 10669 TaxID=1123289 RepID=A0ABZ3ISB9_9FIRM|nr:carbon-phosphorus lyase complex subunit PhnI [Sporomusa silvacetica]OZC20843.1 alpha-D-ribose 1-methylphosphonate 5-triphosphate synthase subunit PhnI [Sporomusa silvacetica DSM 10669]